MPERVVSSIVRPEDAPVEQGLRPQTLDEYIGQEWVAENLMICLEAARARGEPVDHVLLHGPPGLGKKRNYVICLGKRGRKR